MKSLRFHAVLPALAVLALPTVARGQGHGHGRGPQKVTICHIPPGNPANARTLTLPEPALQAHLGHGDTLGPCSGTVGATSATGNQATTDRGENPVRQGATAGRHGHGSEGPAAGLGNHADGQGASGQGASGQGASGHRTPDAGHGKGQRKNPNRNGSARDKEAKKK